MVVEIARLVGNDTTFNFDDYRPRPIGKIEVVGERVKVILGHCIIDTAQIAYRKADPIDKQGYDQHRSGSQQYTLQTYDFC